MVERLAMLSALKKETRVRRDVERRLFQSVKFQIHDALLAKIQRGAKKRFQGV
jgi:hypothetical protein